MWQAILDKFRRFPAQEKVTVTPETAATPFVLQAGTYRLSWKTTDWYHWNDAYGRIVIRDFLSRLHPSLDGQGACCTEPG